MSDLTNLDTLFQGNLTGTAAMALFRQELTAIRQFPGAWPAVTVSIVSDRLTPTQAFTVVETEGSTATDILGLILVTNTHDGMELKLISQDSRTITVLHQPTVMNGITLAGGVAKTLSTTKFMLLKRYGDRWREIVDGSATPDLGTASAAGILQPDGTTIQVSSGGISARTATTALTGVVQLSTTAEAITGTNATKAVTPAGLAARLSNNDDVLPGIVIAFSGTFGGTNSKFPINKKTGVVDLSYALCDGSTYTSPDGRSVTTPNLTSRFIKGSTVAGANATGGGSGTATIAAHTLTAAQMPAHSHGQNTSATYAASDFSMLYRRAGITASTHGTATSGSTFTADVSRVYTGGIGTETRIHTDDVGSGGSHTHTATLSNIEPAYYTLAYIIKL